MNRQQLIDKLTETHALQPAALVRHVKQDSIGIAIILGESMGGAWQSGDLIIFWANGDHTDINPDDDVELLLSLMR